MNVHWRAVLKSVNSPTGSVISSQCLYTLHALFSALPPRSVTFTHIEVNLRQLYTIYTTILRHIDTSCRSSLLLSKPQKLSTKYMLLTIINNIFVNLRSFPPTCFPTGIQKTITQSLGGIFYNTPWQASHHGPTLPSPLSPSPSQHSLPPLHLIHR